MTDNFRLDSVKGMITAILKGPTNIDEYPVPESEKTYYDFTIRVDGYTTTVRKPIGPKYSEYKINELVDVERYSTYEITESNSEFFPSYFLPTGPDGVKISYDLPARVINKEITMYKKETPVDLEAMFHGINLGDVLPDNSIPYNSALDAKHYLNILIRLNKLNINPDVFYSVNKIDFKTYDSGVKSLEVQSSIDEDIHTQKMLFDESGELFLALKKYIQPQRFPFSNSGPSVFFKPAQLETAPYVVENVHLTDNNSLFLQTTVTKGNQTDFILEKMHLSSLPPTLFEDDCFLNPTFVFENGELSGCFNVPLGTKEEISAFYEMRKMDYIKAFNKALYADGKTYSRQADKE